MRIPAAVVCLLMPAAAGAAVGKGSEGGSMVFAVFQMLASLAVVVGMIYLLYYVATRWFKGLPGGKARQGRIRVIETRYLAPKRSLMIVEVGGEYLLLGSGSEGVQLIKKLENGDVVEPGNAASPLQPVPDVFRQKFDEMLGKIRGSLAAVRKTGFTPENILPAGNEAGLLTVEQMIERVNAENARYAAGAQTQRRRAKNHASHLQAVFDRTSIVKSST